MPIKLTGIHHGSVRSTDFERSRGFYAGILGLEEIPYPSTFSSPVLWFQLGEEQIHLMPAREADPPSPRHVALHVEDAKAAREHLVAHGVAVTETVPIPGADRFFIHDPDGNMVEIIQWIRPYPREGA